MDEQKQQVAQAVKEANNILVTVSTNPSVDQLAACIGLTVALNKMGKHATAVFSGEVPHAIAFLEPEKTIERTTDSLRDFIIALDKSKADKLRYKVEDRVVKIFITPYRTSISDKDLEFSQGDFNVDVVLALGVYKQSDLDQAITSHGRILHDAVVMTINNKAGGELGTLNWLDPTGSSLSELAMQLLDMLDKNILDEQIATAMLTGIVAETERFSNAKTTPRTMSISAELMAAGANQQLVATKLEEPAPPAAEEPAAEEVSQTAALPDTPKPDGTLEITHDETPPPSKQPENGQDAAKHTDDSNDSVPEDKAATGDAMPQIHIDEHGGLHSVDESSKEKADDVPSIRHHAEPPKMILEPPTLGGQLTASGMPDAYELLPSDPLTLPAVDAGEPSTPAVAPTIMPPSEQSSTPAVGDNQQSPADIPAPSVADADPAAGNSPSPLNPFAQEKTLSELEKDVHSSHAAAGQDLPTPTFAPAPVNPAPQPPAPAPDASTADANDHATLQDARDAVAAAINDGSSQQPLPPIQALNAQPVDLPIGSTAAPTPAADNTAAPGTVPGPTVVPPADNPAWNPGNLPFQPSFTNQPTVQPPAMPGTMPTLPPPADVTEQGEDQDPNAPPPVPPPMMPFK